MISTERPREAHRVSQEDRQHEHVEVRPSALMLKRVRICIRGFFERRRYRLHAPGSEPA
jgi:hypothetical protein